MVATDIEAQAGAGSEVSEAAATDLKAAGHIQRSIAGDDHFFSTRDINIAVVIVIASAQSEIVVSRPESAGARDDPAGVRRGDGRHGFVHVVGAMARLDL